MSDLVKDLLLAAARRAGKYDSAARRQSQRQRRERGCWVYIPADELLRAGVDLDAPPPLYRTWGTSRGVVLVRLYGSRVSSPPRSPSAPFSGGVGGVA